MTGSILAAGLWAVAATLVAMLPSRNHHGRAAYGLVAAGIPILGWVTYESGPWAGLIILAAGASILRWPLIFLWKRVRRGRRL
ncbi:MAG: DUF2484 family protein [Albidovulum sp.]